MPTVRNKALGKKEYYHNDISVSADKSAWIMKIPTSNSWYFRMWIKEENRQFRKSLRTRDQDEEVVTEWYINHLKEKLYFN